MKRLIFIALAFTFLSSCSSEDINPNYKVKVWNEKNLPFIVLLDNPEACQSVVLYEGIGTYTATIERPDWSKVNLIAQLISGNCDTICVQINKDIHTEQITAIIPL